MTPYCSIPVSGHPRLELSSFWFAFGLNAHNLDMLSVTLHANCNFGQ